MTARKAFFLYDKGVLTLLLWSSRDSRGKVPVSPCLIGAYPSALFLSHYSGGRMLC